MRKLLLIVSLIFLTACTITEYSYYPPNYRNNKLIISARPINDADENSPINFIRVSDVRSNVREPHIVKIFSPIIKIFNETGEYRAKTSLDSGYIYIYNQGLILTGDFTAYIEKIQLDTGEIIDIPPLYFKKHIYVRKYNGFMDALDKSISKDIFKGTVEEYKKGEWKKKK